MTRSIQDVAQRSLDSLIKQHFVKTDHLSSILSIVVPKIRVSNSSVFMHNCSVESYALCYKDMVMTYGELEDELLRSANLAQAMQKTCVSNRNDTLVDITHRVLVFLPVGKLVCQFLMGFIGAESLFVYLDRLRINIV